MKRKRYLIFASMFLLVCGFFTGHTRANEARDSLPLKFSFDYSFVSDYVWRGQDLTPNSSSASHQMTAELELDLGNYGQLGGSTWFQFNDDYTGDCLMEVDYSAYYGYTIKPIGLDTEIGFIYYEFPRAESGNTQEIYLSLEWDDSILWRGFGLDVKDPVLNPYASIYYDIDNGGAYGEMGVSHDFYLTDYGFSDTPVLKDTSVGLSCSMGWANDWFLVADYDGPVTMQYGLSATTDLKKALGLSDDCCGEMYVTGFLNYNHALTNNDSSSESMMADILWGGLTVGFEW